MDSLLASYGSDEEDDEEKHVPSPPKEQLHPPSSFSSQTSGLLSHIPSPLKRPKFSSLPPPKLSSFPSNSLPNPISDDTKVANRHTLATNDPDKLKHEAGGEAMDELGLDAERLSFQSRGIDGSGQRSASISSMLGSLPAPKSGRKVEFRPPVNMSLLKSSYEDEDRVLRPKKPSNDEKEVRLKGGLTAILPPPKHSLGVGAVLGGGTGGRRPAMETLGEGSDHYSSANNQEAINSQNQGEVLNGVNYQSTNAVAASFSAHSNYAGLQSTGHRCDDFDYQHRSYSGAIDGQRSVPYLSTSTIYNNETPFEANLLAAVAQNSGPFMPTNQIHSYELPPEANISAAGGFEPPPEDPLEQVLKRERRRGKEDTLPMVLEVKQDDLTAQKIREDQLRATGIAFGPSYKPVSANKDKPSKLHRRKHQIGSLYFDMKQKEMELLERRAKGNLTKAETQAKYGW